MIEFDPRADITLKVGREKKLFSACSRALSRASPVFERMLYGHFTESKTRLAEGEEWVVELPEDDSAPMEVFLNISHSHFGRVPRRMPLDELYELAVLSNYYDCTRLLEPWINGWMASIEVRDSSVSMAKALWVSWEFGRKEAFSRMALRMLMESDMGRTAEDEFDKLKMPPDIIGAYTYPVKHLGQLTTYRKNLGDPTPDDTSSPRGAPRHGGKSARGGRKAAMVPARRVDGPAPLRVHDPRVHDLLSRQGGPLAPPLSGRSPRQHRRPAPQDDRTGDPRHRTCRRETCPGSSAL